MQAHGPSPAIFGVGPPTTLPHLPFRADATSGPLAKGFGTECPNRFSSSTTTFAALREPPRISAPAWGSRIALITLIIGCMDPKAHTPNPRGAWHALRNHLEAVSRLAGGFTQGFGTPSLGQALALLYDLGEATQDFQSCLQVAAKGKRTNSMPHAVWGAALAYMKPPAGVKGGEDAACTGPKGSGRIKTPGKAPRGPRMRAGCPGGPGSAHARMNLVEGIRLEDDPQALLEEHRC